MLVLSFLTTFLAALVSATPTPQPAPPPPAAPAPAAVGNFPPQLPTCPLHTWGECTPGAWQCPKACGMRATCENFNANDQPSTYGTFYCVCQAGYRAWSVGWWNSRWQHRMTWVNDYGDQTHRVFVPAQVDCLDLCDIGQGNPRNCSEVPLRDQCR